MTEIPRSHSQDEPSDIDGSDSNARITDQRTAKPTGRTNAGSACRSLAFFGTWTGWGLAALGVMAGVEHVLDSAAVSMPNPARVSSAVLGALSWSLAFCLAGWGVAVITKVTASIILECLEHAARASELHSIGMSQTVAQLERLVESLRQPVGPAISSSAPLRERAQAIAEIARDTRAANWVVAQTRLDELEASFPNDPELSLLREQLARARHDAVHGTLSQLSAAREVNDPDRVLEIYQVVLPSLDQPERIALERDLAKWFLSLIHRRLRLGKVQPDVVQLAARFSEIFASTVEGASVRASLSTLRRSVGLCPRCGEPYTGIADACPKCLRAASTLSATLVPGAEINHPE
jgi:hypothetical protein